MMPEAVNDVSMPSLCFHKRIFFCKFGDNIILVGMSWQYKFIGQYKDIALKMLPSPENKSGDNFNICLQKSIAWWEPSLRHQNYHLHYQCHDDALCFFMTLWKK